MHGVNQSSPARLLLVDDEPVVRDLLARWLRDDGYSCATASSAATAWAHLQEHPVDLVTLDIRMPGGSGLDLLDQIKQTVPDTAAIMLTAEGDTTKAIRALTAGAYGYLIKPIERQELLIQVRNALERRRLVIENREYTQELENKVREQTRVIRMAHEETIHRLVKASLYRDEETGAHIKRTGWYSELMAATIGWDPERVEQIRLAAPMHDIGKIAIPDVILCKPGKLTHKEVAVMQTHAQLGARLLAGSQSPVLRMACEIALGHHERWDGDGYPSGLHGSEIPEAARIVAIVDVFDALSHDRVYRPALPEQQVLKILRSGRGTHFDPELLDVFLSLLPEMRAIAEALTDVEEEDEAVESSAADFVPSHSHAVSCAGTEYTN
jgi:putative two-component system response regulator